LELNFYSLRISSDVAISTATILVFNTAWNLLANDRNVPAELMHSAGVAVDPIDNSSRGTAEPMAPHIEVIKLLTVIIESTVTGWLVTILTAVLWWPTHKSKQKTPELIKLGSHAGIRLSWNIPP
jgi:hypothetical protein